MTGVNADAEEASTSKIDSWRQATCSQRRIQLNCKINTNQARGNDANVQQCGEGRAVRDMHAHLFVRLCKHVCSMQAFNITYQQHKLAV